jgi:hypothetical protein
MSALGHKRTCALQWAMSALPPKADMCVALAYACFGPKADIRVSIDLQPRPRGLAVPERTVAAPAVMELSELAQVSERVFSNLPV